MTENIAEIKEIVQRFLNTYEPTDEEVQITEPNSIGTRHLEILIDTTPIMVNGKLTHWAESIVDSNGLQALLRALQAKGAVGEATKCMWCGMRGTMFLIWCVI